MPSTQPPYCQYGYTLPSIDDGGDRLAVAPGLAHLSIPAVSPDVEPLIGVAELPAVYAGTLLGTTPARCAQQLTADWTAIVSQLLNEDISPRAAGTRLATIDAALSQVDTALSPYYQTAVHLFLNWVLGDPDYHAWYTEAYARNNEAADIADLRAVLNSMQSDWDGYDEKFAEAVHDVRTAYGVDVAQRVVDHALSPRIYSLTDLEISVAGERRTLSQDAILARARRACRMFETSDSPQQLVSDERHTSLEPTPVEESSDPAIEPRRLPDITTTDADGEPAQPSQDSLSMVGTPSGLSWLIDRTVASGQFRAAIYHRHGHCKWITAPGVDGSTDVGGSDMPSWQSAFLARGLVKQVVARPSATSASKIRCPLCSLRDAKCGSDGCAQAEAVSRMRQHATAVRAGFLAMEG